MGHHLKDGVCVWLSDCVTLSKFLRDSIAHGLSCIALVRILPTPCPVWPQASYFTLLCLNFLFKNGDHISTYTVIVRIGWVSTYKAPRIAHSAQHSVTLNYYYPLFVSLCYFVLGFYLAETYINRFKIHLRDRKCLKYLQVENAWCLSWKSQSGWKTELSLTNNAVGIS